tara:strand:- start:369 stop:980 length:612 start_codon:yes stop_codon:yes gene_type:complete
MEIKWLGESSIFIKTNISTLLVEPTKEILDSNIKEHNLICLYYQEKKELRSNSDYNLFSGPGEYESGGIALRGIPTAGTTVNSEKIINTIYNVELEGMQTAFFGRPSSKFTDNVIRELGKVDILIIPSNDQILDSDQIAYAVREIEPKLVILSNHGESGVISNNVKNLVSELGTQIDIPVNKLNVAKSNLTESRQVIVLEEVL